MTTKIGQYQSPALSAIFNAVSANAIYINGSSAFNSNIAVPYVGAISGVNLNTKSLTANSISALSIFSNSLTSITIYTLSGGNGTRDIITIFGNANSGATTGRLIFASGRDDEGGANNIFIPVGGIGGFLSSTLFDSYSGGLIFYYMPLTGSGINSSSSTGLLEGFRLKPDGNIYVNKTITIGSMASTTSIGLNVIPTFQDSFDASYIGIKSKPITNIIVGEDLGTLYAGWFETSTHPTNEFVPGTMIGIYASATGGSINNYAAIFDQGRVGFGTKTPLTDVHVTGSISAGKSISAQMYYGDGGSLSKIAALSGTNTFTQSNTFNKPLKLSDAGGLNSTTAEIQFIEETSGEKWKLRNDALSVLYLEFDNGLINRRLTLEPNNSTTLSGNLTITNGTIRTSGYLSSDGTAGLSVTRVFTDLSSIINTVTIKNGLITEWTQV